MKESLFFPSFGVEVPNADKNEEHRQEQTFDVTKAPRFIDIPTVDKADEDSG